MLLSLVAFAGLANSRLRRLAVRRELEDAHYCLPLAYKPAVLITPRCVCKRLFTFCLSAMLCTCCDHTPRPSRNRMPVLRPLPQPTSLIVSTPVSSNLPLLNAHSIRNKSAVLADVLSCYMTWTWMYLLWVLAQEGHYGMFALRNVRNVSGNFESGGAVGMTYWLLKSRRCAI